MVKLKHVLKRSLVITLCSAMVITSGNFTIPGMPGMVKVQAEETQGQEENLITNPSFEENTNCWYDGNNLEIIKDGRYLKITGKDKKALLAQDLKAEQGANVTFKNNTEYEFSAKVKLDENSGEDIEVKAGLGIKTGQKLEDGSDEWQAGDSWNLTSTTVTGDAISKGWKEIKGTFKPTFTNQPVSVSFQLIGTSKTDETVFYAKDISLVEKNTSNNLIANPSFDSNINDSKDPLNVYWWFKDNDDTFEIQEDTAVKVKGTGEALLAQNLSGEGCNKEIGQNTKYNFSLWVKKSDDCQETVQVTTDLMIKNIPGTEAEYSSINEAWQLNSTPVTVNENWQQITGSFITDNQEFEEFHFKVTGKGTGSISFYADNISLTKSGETIPGGTTPEKPGEDVKPEKGTNLLDNPSFDGAVEPWFATGGKLEYIPDGGCDKTGGCVKLTEKTDSWNSLAQDIKDKVKDKTKYNFSCQVKLCEEYETESTVKAGLTIKSTGDNNGDESYDGWGISHNTVKASKDEWREIKGSFMANWNGELQTLQFKVADETVKEGKSIYVDNLSITENNVELSIEKDIESLKDLFVKKDSGYNFKVGGALEAGILSNDKKMELVQKHYNSITAGNEMKPDYVIKGINADGSLKLDFTIPDSILQYFWDYNKDKEEKDKIHIRGHVLCWYSQTPDFFFKDENGNPLSKEVMNKRLEEYIQKFVTHVQTEYPGLVYCWDVVNEAIIPGDGVKGGLRRYFNDGQKETGYYQIYGDSNEYIINAFKYANKYAEPEVKLFYNDYGETDPVKVKCICDLADEIAAADGARIDGIGMQSHHSVESPSAEELYNAIKAYGKNGREVQITELDLLASKSYDGSDGKKETELVKEAYRYKEFIDAILKAKKEGTNITALVFWGVADDDSWLVTDEFSDGRHNMPLLFDENLKAKPAYWGIADPDRLPPYIKEENVIESAGKDWTLAPAVSVGKNSSMKFLWSNEKLYVQVTVKDTTSDVSDNVTIYLDKDNIKADNADDVKVITINRSEAKATADGYIAEKEIGIAGKAANSQIGLDVVVYDETPDTRECWNDTKMGQENRSKYYGTLTLKPFMAITKGMADIDGEIDSAWNSVEAHKLTVSSNKSVSTTGTVKSMWSEDYLYVLAQIKDAVLNKDNAQAHEQDSLEIFVDENNGKTGSYETDDCQYRINYDNELSFNGPNCKPENIQSKTKKTSDGYIVEARIKFNTIKGAENNLIGVDFQINDADASGVRVATINWYDASGMGYARPAVFGTAKLVAADTFKTDISDAKVTGIKNYSYTGKEIQPGLTVESAGKKLAEGTDYTLSYKDNINSGNATVTITGCGDYTGEIFQQFKITKAKQKITVKKSSYNKTTSIKSFKLTGISGYGKLSYKSSKTKVVTVNKNGKVKIKGAGTAKITVTASGGKNYKKAKTVIKVKIVSKK